MKGKGPGYRPHHGRWALDELVRPSRAANSTIRNRTPDSARRSGGSGSASDKFEHVPPLFPLEAVDEYYKQLVPNGEVSLPGSTCESCDPKELSPANTWTPQNLATLVEQLGRRRRGHALRKRESWASHGADSQGARPSESAQGTRDARRVVLAAEQRTDRSGLRQHPYMALKGDYTATSMVCQETVDAINARRASKQGTAKADYLKLDEMGILGVTHMMMLDKKNLEIADVIYNWIGKGT
jgi:hypothetical protein